MSIEEEIRINQFGQGIRQVDDLVDIFHALNEADKRRYLSPLSFFLLQSKPTDNDIVPAIVESGLKATYTSCVVLRTHGLKIGLDKIRKLPGDELEKVFRLMLFLFKQGYQRRYEQEKDDPHKWWYWDLSKDETVQQIISARVLGNI